MIDPFAEPGMRAPDQRSDGWVLGHARCEGPLFLHDDKRRHTPLAAARRARQYRKRPETCDPVRSWVCVIRGAAPFWSFLRYKPPANGAVPADRHSSRKGAREARYRIGMTSARARMLGREAGHSWGQQRAGVLRTVLHFWRGACVPASRPSNAIENGPVFSVRAFMADPVRELCRAGSVLAAVGFARFAKWTKPLIEPHRVFRAGFCAIGRNGAVRMLWVLMHRAGKGGSV